MRRLIVIVSGFIVLLLIVAAVVFGLKTPEMPIKEVHKAIALPSPQKKMVTPSLPAVPGPPPSVPSPPSPSGVPPIIIPYQQGQANGSPQAVKPQGETPVPSLPQPGSVPGNALGNGSGP